MATEPENDRFREALRAQIQGILAAAVDAGFEGYIDLDCARVTDDVAGHTMQVPHTREVRRLPLGAPPPPAGECIRFEIRAGKYRQMAPQSPDHLA